VLCIYLMGNLEIFDKYSGWMDVVETFVVVLRYSMGVLEIFNGCSGDI